MSNYPRMLYRGEIHTDWEELLLSIKGHAVESLVVNSPEEEKQFRDEGFNDIAAFLNQKDSSDKSIHGRADLGVSIIGTTRKEKDLPPITEVSFRALTPIAVPLEEVKEIPELLKTKRKYTRHV